MKGHGILRAALLLSLGISVFLGALSNPQSQKLDLIREAIREKGAHWIPKETNVSQLGADQFNAMLGDRSREISTQEPIIAKTLDSYPASIDWRNMGGSNYVTSVKAQDSCGSCVAFSAAATLEALICIEYSRPGENIDLSEMNIFMCGCGNCCGTGWRNDLACYYMRYFGVPDEFCWPYIPEYRLCSNSCTNKTLRDVQIAHYGYILGEEYYKMAVAFAPIMTSIKVYEDFPSYGGGIYEHVWGDFLGMHSVCIIGYDTQGVTPYWIVKNCWDTDWGEGGFGKIKMGECEIEAGGYWISDAIIPSIPILPDDLVATYDSSNGAVNLSWGDNSNNEMIFEIQRQIGTGEFEHIADIAENTTSCLDNNISGESESYSYRVCAVNIAGSSGFSNTATITTPPIAPTALAVMDFSDAFAELEWQDNSLVEEGFEVWQKTGSGSWTLKTSVGQNVCSTEIDGLEESTLHYFKVRAINYLGPSAWSNEVSLTTLLKAPSNLVANSFASDSIYLQWKDNSSKESGFEIWQQENGGDWHLSKTVGVNYSISEITGLTSGANYCYKLRAYNAANQSDWSNISCATTQSGVPATPSNLVVTGYCWEVNVQWQDNSDNETGFAIYRQSGSYYFWLGTVGPNTTTFWDIDVFCGGGNYCYKVRSFNENGQSPASLSRCARTSSCNDCWGRLVLSVMPNKALIGEGDTVTYEYKIVNKGEVDITNVAVIDSAFGQLLSNGIIKKGDTMIIRRVVTLTDSLTNIAEATGTFITPTNETKLISAHASSIVRLR